MTIGTPPSTEKEKPVAVQSMRYLCVPVMSVPPGNGVSTSGVAVEAQTPARDPSGPVPIIAHGPLLKSPEKPTPRYRSSVTPKSASKTERAPRPRHDVRVQP